MVNKLVFAQRFLLLVTPLVTSSALAPLVIGIGASSSQAATLAVRIQVVDGGMREGMENPAPD